MNAELDTLYKAMGHVQVCEGMCVQRDVCGHVCVCGMLCVCVLMPSARNITNVLVWFRSR